MGTEKKVVEMQRQQWRKERNKERRQLRELLRWWTFHHMILFKWTCGWHWLENGWFSGIIQRKEDMMFEINFMEPGLNLCIYKWPLEPNS